MKTFGIFALLCALPVLQAAAAPRYYMVMRVEDRSYAGAFSTEEESAPYMLTPELHAVIEVNKMQYGGGGKADWPKVTERQKDEAIAAAKEERAKVENKDEETRAIVRAILSVGNEKWAKGEEATEDDVNDQIKTNITSRAVAVPVSGP